MSQNASQESAHFSARKIRLLIELRRAGIKDTRVLGALERVPREAFTPPSFRDQAYANRALPIGHGQTLSQPLVVALMTQALALRGTERVLEIGTGSGYQAAVLAQLAVQVCTIERWEELLAEAEGRFEALGLTNVFTKLGDGMLGWPEAAPFDAILVTAAAAEAVPPALVEQLGTGGRLVLPLGPHQGEQELVRITRRGSRLLEERLGPVRFVPLLPGLASDGP